MTISNVVAFVPREKPCVSNIVENELNAEFLLKTLLYLNLEKQVLKYTLPVTVRGNIYHITSVLLKQDNPNIDEKKFNWETYFHSEEVGIGDLISFAGDRT